MKLGEQYKSRRGYTRNGDGRTMLVGTIVTIIKDLNDLRFQYDDGYTISVNSGAWAKCEFVLYDKSARSTLLNL